MSSGPYGPIFIGEDFPVTLGNLDFDARVRNWGHTNFSSMHETKPVQELLLNEPLRQGLYSSIKHQGMGGLLHLTFNI